MKKLPLVALAATAVFVGPVSAANLTALTSFGGGDGWLAPGESGYVADTSSLARGLTYNAATNKLYVVDRTGGINVRIYNGNTGAAEGTFNVTGISGGTFTLNMIDVDATGVVYAANLSTANTTNFKMYRWTDPAVAPSLAFDGLTNRVRTGDTFAVTGSGATTRFIAAGGPTVNENYALFSTANGTTFTSANPVLTGAVAGGFRLGIDFGANGAVLGKQTGSTALFSAASDGTVISTALTSSGEAPMAFYSNGSETYFASVDVNSNTVNLYDQALSAPSMSSLNLTTSFNPNGNGVGDLKFGLGPDGGLRLYVLNTNNGIQAFNVVPEPSTTWLGLAALGLALRRRR